MMRVLSVLVVELVVVVVLAEGLGPDCVSWCCEEG